MRYDGKKKVNPAGEKTLIIRDALRRQIKTVDGVGSNGTVTFKRRAIRRRIKFIIEVQK